jgi:AraC family transcriptional regulator
MMRTVLPVCSEAEEFQLDPAAHTQVVERVIGTMHTHLQELLTLEDLASVACLSPFYFNRVFRRLIGVPPVAFLSALRFQMARQLLLTTSLSVTDICFEVGYTSTSSFTYRFTHLAGLSPRLLRQRAGEFELPLEKPAPGRATSPDSFPVKNTLVGRISAPTTFRGTIYVGLFPGPIPQGRPVRCTRLCLSGGYRITGIPDGVYYLLAAAFPVNTNLQLYLLPGEKLLLAHNTHPLVICNGHISGDPNLTLHPPHLTDAPLVMALPLL